MKDLNGKVAAVTGAASGLGRSMALAQRLSGSGQGRAAVPAEPEAEWDVCGTGWTLHRRYRLAGG